MYEELQEVPFDRERIFEGKIITLERWKVKLPNGQDADREIILHKGAAAVVPVDDEGIVTLVRQCRIAVGKITLEIPAGKLDGEGEDPLVCASRELEEETGLCAKEIRLLSAIDTTPGFCSERIHIYLATGLTSTKAHPDEDEFVALVRMPLVDAVQLVASGEICDAKSCVGLLLAHKALSAE